MDFLFHKFLSEINGKKKHQSAQKKMYVYRTIIPRLRMDRNSSKQTGHFRGVKGEDKVANDILRQGLMTDCEDFGNPGPDCLCASVVMGNLDLYEVKEEEGMDSLVVA